MSADGSRRQLALAVVFIGPFFDLTQWPLWEEVAVARVVSSPGRAAFWPATPEHCGLYSATVAGWLPTNTKMVSARLALNLLLSLSLSFSLAARQQKLSAQQAN